MPDKNPLCNLSFVFLVDMRMTLHVVLAPILIFFIMKEKHTIMAEGNLKLIMAREIKCRHKTWTYKHCYLCLGNCEDKNLAGCSFYGQSVGCNKIELASSMLQKSLQEICQNPVSQFSCDGTGIIKDYCPKTCSSCGKNITRYALAGR